MIDQNSGSTSENIQLLFKKHYVEISYDKQNRIIIARWIGGVNLSQVLESFALITDFVKEHKLVCHYSDHTDLRILPSDVQDYFTTTWFFEIEKLGLRKIAARRANDIFTQATVRRVINMNTYDELQIKQFPTYEEAYKWLLSK